VFLAPPWREIYRTDSERKQDFAEAERTYRGLWETYEECGYRLIELPKLEPIARARFVCEHLEVALAPRERR
jgi:predicted ATPase